MAGIINQPLGGFVQDFSGADIEKMLVYQSLLRGLFEAERGEFLPDSFLDDLIQEICCSQTKNLHAKNS